MESHSLVMSLITYCSLIPIVISIKVACDESPREYTFEEPFEMREYFEFLHRINKE